MRKTIILGATTNPARYAYMAAERLVQHHELFVPVGIKTGEVLGQPILDLRQEPPIADVDTITMYMNADHQNQWSDYILSLCPKRIIFNPGAENPDLAAKAQSQGIATENACTLVMLASGVY
jgi:hypothetical protein